MKLKANHLPEEKVADLDKITETIKEFINTYMIILFGSYARGDYVEDIYEEDGRTYEYKSDYDILVIHKGKNVKEKVVHKLEKDLSRTFKFGTPVNIIYHDIEFINNKLQSNEYFFTDIKKEGCVLYNSGEVKLAKVKDIWGKERQNLAQEDFDYWFEKGCGFLRGYSFHEGENDNSLAAFNLHQAAESFFSAILLVFSHYKPKIHDLKKLSEISAALDKALFNALPNVTQIEQEHFDILRKAYIDSRYKKDFSVTKEQLLFMGEMVKALQEVTERECLKKIAAFGEE